MNKVLFLLLLLLKLQECLTQPVTRVPTKNFNSWLVYSGDHKFSKKWGIHLDVQWRRNKFFTDPQQIVIRTGINHHFNNQVVVTAGYAFAESYPFGEFPIAATFTENRIWEQVQLKNQLSSVEWSSRYRLEQRFSHLPVRTGNAYKSGPSVYTNRMRILNRFSLPLKGKVIEDRSFYISAYDEVFINFGKNVGYNILDQNRAAFSLGYKIPNAGRVEVGYLYQLSMKSDGIKIENNHTLQIAFYSTFNFFKEKKELFSYFLPSRNKGNY